MSWAPEETTELTESHCGLAGVFPNSRNSENWIGQVIFNENNNIFAASVTYSPPQSATHVGAENLILKLSRNISSALQGFCGAATEGQKRGIVAFCN